MNKKVKQEEALKDKEAKEEEIHLRNLIKTEEEEIPLKNLTK